MDKTILYRDVPTYTEGRREGRFRRIEVTISILEKISSSIHQLPSGGSTKKQKNSVYIRKITFFFLPP